MSFPRRIILGEKAGEALVSVLNELGGKKVLVVSDEQISKLPFFKEIMEHLQESFIVNTFLDVEAEPRIEIAEQIATLAKEADAVIAVGGGSVIDAAKAGTVLAKRPNVRIEDIAPFSPLRIELERPILIAVPTTAGTGSDASYGIVLTKLSEEGHRIKLAVGSYEVVPFATILDPSIPRGAPKSIRVGALADALSHAIEALVSTSANPFSDALAMKAAVIIFTEAQDAVIGGKEDAWEHIHAAATMAGMAFTNSGLGLAHAIAHSLGPLLGTHHGTTVGIVLPHVVRIYLKNEQAWQKLLYLQKELELVYGLPKRNDIVDHIYDLYFKIGHPSRFQELGISPDKYMRAVETALEHVYHDPDIAFSPVVPDLDEIREIMLGMY